VLNNAFKVNQLRAFSADLHRMPLLMKVVKEVNRAYPAGGGILSRQSFDTTEIDGKVVPAGTVAIVNSLLLHHDPRFYEKPNDFNPLRWADASLEALLDDTNRLSFVTYGAGCKSCPANRLAMMQQAVTLAKIVATATFSYTPRGPPKVELGFGAMPTTAVQIVAHAR
jgi:cytochrome P450 family 82 subfamily G polypeptide 1